MDTCVAESQAAIGIFGGTFDPIHFGHLRLAEELAESIVLRQVRFIPAGQPPHRRRPQTSATHRLAMVRLATADNPRFDVDDREIRRATPSWTVDTLESLRAELGDQQPLYLLLGADAFLGLPGWHRWQHLFDLTHIAIAHRPGYPQTQWQDAMTMGMREQFEQRWIRQPDHTSAAGQIVTCPITALDISATSIRDALTHGRSPRYLLPEQVRDYIHQHHLYQPEPA